MLEQIRSVVLRARLEGPDRPLELARRRQQRHGWERDRLVIVAMDHPGRRVLAAGGDPWAMADRADLLWRLAKVLMQPGVDGLLATPDVLEDLLVLNDTVVSAGGPDFMSRKVLVGSMNRGGLADTAFELDDFLTGYTAAAIQRMRLDAGKFLLRLRLDTPDTANTLRYCVAALEELSALQIPMFLEPLAVPHSEDDLVRAVGVASALGSTSARRWLKLPMVADLPRVARATTCPIVLLGGGNPGHPDELLTTISRCLDQGPNVRGLMIGRGLLYPQDGSDPAVRAAELAACVHGRDVEEVVLWQTLSSTRWDA
ncbi:MAG: hypothetical protein K6T78_14840 [Alicyclobacillus sp.]|nr:hypothetical protein [Alicyclobacillus sp.]